MRHALFLVVVLLGSILAGCAEDAPGAQLTQETFSIARVLRMHVDNENVQKAEDGEVDPYDFVTNTFVVTVGGTPTRASALTVAYTDRDGNDVERPLSDFTTQAELAPGAQVMVQDANLTSGAVLKLDGVEIASRARGPVDWWVVQGYPIGFAMEPGSSLKYKLTSASSQRLGFVDLDAPDADVRIDQARLSFDSTFEGELEFGYGADAEPVQANTSHTARPLAWRTTGQMSLPLVLEALGTNTSSGEALEAGLETLPGTGVDYDAHGTLWWNDSLAPVRLDLEGGRYDTRVDMIVWLTGVEDMMFGGEFSCMGKTRADACRPTEWGLEEVSRSDTLEPESENLDTVPWNVQPEILANLTRLLAEDLRPGDEMRFDVDLDQSVFPVEEGAPEKLRIQTEALLRAVGYESVTVGAGTFEALKVVERVSVRFELGETTGEDGVTYGPLTVDESLAETDFWLQKDTFVPLRIEQRMPFDFQRVMRSLIDAAPAEAWEGAGLEVPDPSAFEFTLTATVALELTRMDGTARFAPWALFTVFHGIGAAAAAPLTGLGMHGLDTVYEYDDPYYDWDEPVWEESYEREPVEWAPPEHVPGHLALESVAPLSSDGLVKEYRVVEVSEDLPYYTLSLRLDGGDASYDAGDDHQTWCVVDAATGACIEDMPYLVESDQVLRLTSPTPMDGKTFEVVEMWYDDETERFEQRVLVALVVE